MGLGVGENERADGLDGAQVVRRGKPDEVLPFSTSDDLVLVLANELDAEILEFMGVVGERDEQDGEHILIGDQFGNLISAGLFKFGEEEVVSIDHEVEEEVELDVAKVETL